MIAGTMSSCVQRSVGALPVVAGLCHSHSISTECLWLSFDTVVVQLVLANFRVWTV